MAHAYQESSIMQALTRYSKRPLRKIIWDKTTNLEKDHRHLDISGIALWGQISEPADAY